jgi:hypothetical protein
MVASTLTGIGIPPLHWRLQQDTVKVVFLKPTLPHFRD